MVVNKNSIVTPVDPRCFHCYGRITEDTLIVWNGDGQICFHIDCAVDFGLRILRDVHEVECRQNLRVALVKDSKKVKEKQ